MTGYRRGQTDRPPGRGQGHRGREPGTGSVRLHGPRRPGGGRAADRPAGSLRAPAVAAGGSAVPQPPVDPAGPEEPGRRGHPAPPGGRVGRAGGGVPAGGRGAARLRAGGVRGAEPPAGLRPDDRLGAGRPAGRDGRPRHRLHRGVRHPGAHRAGGRAPGPPAEPDRGLRRRRHAAGDRGAGRAPGAGAVRPGPGHRRRDGRRVGDARLVPLRAARGGRRGRTAGAPTCWTAGRRSTTPTPPPTGGTWRWARWSPSSTPSCWPALAWTRRACPRSTTAPAGRSCGPGSPRRSPGGPRHSGWRRSRARTPAWRRWSARQDAPAHPHNAARETFIDVGGVVQPAPAPRFGRTPCGPPSPPVRPGSSTRAVLAGLGLTPAQITALQDSGAVS